MEFIECVRTSEVFVANRARAFARCWTRYEAGIVNVTRRRTRQPRLRQTECRKSHVNSARRLICKHNARQLYGLPSSGRMRSLRVSPVSLVNFSRRPRPFHPRPFPRLPFVPPILGSSCSTSPTASPCPGHRVSKRFNDRFLVRSRVSFRVLRSLSLSLSPSFSSFPPSHARVFRVVSPSRRRAG